MVDTLYEVDTGENERQGAVGLDHDAILRCVFQDGELTAVHIGV